MASGVAHRLFQCGFAVLMLETFQPTVIRRSVSFAEAVYRGEQTVEGVQAVLAGGIDDVAAILKAERICVLADPQWEALVQLQPQAVVDAVMAKQNLGTSIDDAPVTIGLGPGFTAGGNVQAVIETQRGHDLGRVLYKGAAAPNTGVPGEIQGYTTQRLLRAPVAGQFRGLQEIGDLVTQGQPVAAVGKEVICAPISGVLRGIMKTGLQVTAGCKIGDIDPRGVKEYCFTISDKARCVAGGVLEALIYLGRREELWMSN